MNITYILGNGFDIQCGLATRYSDFLKEYTVIQQGDNENIIEFKKYLSKSENQELWSNAEKAMGIHLKDFSNTNIEDFTERIADFESKMIKYLEVQQSKCLWKNFEAIYQVFNDFLGQSFKDIISYKSDTIQSRINKENNIIEFITFNYTDILENIIECYYMQNNFLLPDMRSEFDVSDNIYHVHGRLESSIIMGVNDVGQVRLDGGVTLTDRLKKQLVKPEMNYAMGHIWDNPAILTIKTSDIIVIYGVSFGETDNIWWRIIREWLEEDAAHKMVVFVNDERERINAQIAWQAQEYDILKSTETLQKLGYRKNYFKFNQLLKQVCIILNTSRLNLKPIILNNSLKENILDKAAMDEMNSTAKMI